MFRVIGLINLSGSPVPLLAGNSRLQYALRPFLAQLRGREGFGWRGSVYISN